MGCTLGTGKKTVETPDSGADTNGADAKVQTEHGGKGAVGAGNEGALSDVSQNEVNQRLYEKRDVNKADVTPKPNGNITQTPQGVKNKSGDTQVGRHDNTSGQHQTDHVNVTMECKETKINVVHEKLKPTETANTQGIY